MGESRMKWVYKCYFVAKRTDLFPSFEDHELVIAKNYGDAERIILQHPELESLSRIELLGRAIQDET